MSTLFSVGNSRCPMPRLLTLVCAFAEQLPQPIYVQYGHNSFDCKKVESFGFLSEVEFGKHMSKAAVIVLHGGAVSILQANQLGRVPVVMPRRREMGEHIDNHQISLCRKFSEAGKIVVLEEAEDLLHAIAKAKALEASLDHQSNVSRMVKLVAGAIEAAANS